MKKKARMFTILFLQVVLLMACAKKDNNEALDNDAKKAQTEETKREKADGSLYVEGAKLVNDKGESVCLRGVSSENLSQFGQYINQASILQMKEEWNMNVVRLAVYTEGEGGYCVSDEDHKKALKEKIEEVVSAAEEAGMYVVIDWHILTDSNPEIYQQEAVAFFREMAKKYQDKNHVMYEICNEPGGDTNWGQISEYAGTVIPEIREFTDAVILVGTPNGCRDIEEAVSAPLTADNVMYTYHLYTSDGTTGGQEKLSQAVEDGFPVFVSEFGIGEAGRNEKIDTSEAKQWMDLLEQYEISYTMWNFSDLEESCALIKPNLNKVSGFTKDELTPSGQWLLEQLH